MGGATLGFAFLVTISMLIIIETVHPNPLKIFPHWLMGTLTTLTLVLSVVAFILGLAAFSDSSRFDALIGESKLFFARASEFEFL